MSIAAKLAHYFIPHESNNHKARFLQPSPIAYLAGGFVLIQLLISRPAIGSAVLGYASNITPDAILSFTNQKRTANSAPPVKQDPDLVAAAQAKAADMFAKDYWAHVSPDGTQPWYFITHASYNYLLAGENLARDFNESSQVVDAWMNSPSHRENLLNPKYQDIGVAVVNGRLGGVETTLVVQMFGTRLSSQPAVAQASSVVKIAQATDVSPTLAPAPTLRVSVMPSIGQPEKDSGQSAIILPNTAPSPRVLVSPFSLTRGFASFILILLVILLLVDALVIWRNKIVRLSSDSAAHIAFLLTITIAIWLIRAGVIL